MRLTLKKLIITNFKGIRSLTVDFGENETKIYGKNAAGKTTTADAFFWLLFDKNSVGEKEFKFKPLDNNGEDIHKILTKVEGFFLVDNISLQLARTWEENWVTHTGEVLEKMEGHIGKYYINEIKVSAKEYKEKIRSLFTEDIFDILATPFGFANLDWKKRREILFELTNAKKIEENILSGYSDIVNDVKKIGKDGFKALLKQKISVLNKEIQRLEIRIEEARKDIVNEDTLNDKERELTAQKQDIIKQIEQLQETVKAIEEKIKKENEEYLKYVNKKSTIEANIKEIENKIQQFTERKERVKLEKEKTIILKKEEVVLLEEELNITKEKINELIEEQKKGFEVSEEDRVCKLCRQPLPSDLLSSKIKDMEQTFYNKIRLEIQQLKNRGENIKGRINNLQLEIEMLSNITTDNDETAKLLEELNNNKKKLEALIPVEKKEININEIESSRKKLYEQKAQIDTKLSLIEESKRKNEYVKKLEQEYSTQCKEALKLKSKLIAIEKLEQDIANTIEEKVNDLFKNEFVNIKIRMFNRLINEGLEPTCEILIGKNLIPFFNANRGLQINSGCLIANTLANMFNCFIPIFIDNAESVNKIVDINLQKIKLFVTEDEQIRVERW
ncbi:MAG: AAA family ATPase [Candidatus Pacearchaeota archaeon]